MGVSLMYKNYIVTPKIVFYILIFLFAIETIYYNILFDVLLVSLLLLTSFSIGSLFSVGIKPIDRFIVHTILGLGILGFVFWITSLFNIHSRSIFVIISLVPIGIRYKYIYISFKKVIRTVGFFVTHSKVNLSLISMAFMFFILVASYPIWQYDALAKHIAVPFKMLTQNHWDYNIIEYVGYGDYSTVLHCYYLYLMALGGTKALAIFNTFVSFFILFILLRLSRFIKKSHFITTSLILMYTSTPLVYILSTVLYVDILPSLFILTAILILANKGHSNTFKNIYIASFLMGTAIFGKQIAIFSVIPICLFIIFKIYSHYRHHVINFIFLIKAFCISSILFFIPFLPSMLIVWYKIGNPMFPYMNGIFNSKYFTLGEFVEPFHDNPLGFNLHSLLSMVFHTSRNMELADGGLGYFLLLMFLVPLPIIFVRHKMYLIITFITVLSYTLTSLMTANIRYFIVTIILSMVVCVFNLDLVANKIKNKYAYRIFISTVFLLIFVPNVLFTFNPTNYWGFKPAMLHPNNNFTINPNESILRPINNKNVRVLSNNDVFRGTFLGEFYSLTWYNDYLINKVRNGQITPAQFISAFDYYLLDTQRSENYSEYFSLTIPEINRILTLVDKTSTHSLYKVNNFSAILTETFKIPISVTISTPEIRLFHVSGKKYEISIEAEKTISGPQFGRWQINWMDETSTFISTTLIPYEIKEGTEFYNSPIIQDVPDNATTGILFLSSHDESSLKIHSFKLIGEPENIIDRELNEYSIKWPGITNH
jgi:hypothetical protein